MRREAPDCDQPSARGSENRLKPSGLHCWPLPRADAVVISVGKTRHLDEVEFARPGDLDVPGLATRPGRGVISITWSPRGERLADVVGDEDDRAPGLLPDPVQIVVQLVAGDGVERREGLVHQQQLRFLGQGAGQRAALTHATRQLMRPALGEVDQADHAEQPVDRLVALGAAHLVDAHRELDVAPDGEPGQQSRILEHDRRAAVGDVDGALGRLVEPGDHRQQRRLAAPGSAEDAEELTAGDFQGHVLECGEGGLAMAENLCDPSQGHKGSSGST